jgi:hypothetical protein
LFKEIIDRQKLFQWDNRPIFRERVAKDTGDEMIANVILMQEE